MSDRSRKTSDIVKHVDEVEETIPDFYGPQIEEPSEQVKKGDLWFRYSGNENGDPVLYTDRNVTLKKSTVAKSPTIKVLRRTK